MEDCLKKFHIMNDGSVVIIVCIKKNDTKK